MSTCGGGGKHLIKAKSSSSHQKQTTLLNFFTVKTTSSSSNGALEEVDITLSSPAKKKLKLSSSPNKSEEGQGSSDADKGPASLTPEQRRMIQNKATVARILRQSHEFKILDPQMGPSWFSALQMEFQKEYFKDLSDFVTAERNRKTVFPPAHNVWEWTKHSHIQDVKVVIIGQDPYHGPSQAHGLCFSVQKGVHPPPSLMNMYKELKTDVEGFEVPKHGYLMGWAEQGVLLLNAVLTVESGKANSHKDKGWEKITDAVISWISSNLNSVVFLLWGSHAQKKAAVVDKKRHHLLQTVHPSPLSAHRGFFGCKHFSKCNEILEKNGKKPIDWTYLPAP